MCMLSMAPPNRLPDMEELENGTDVNPDGFGYAIVIPGDRPYIRTFHTLNANEALTMFEKERSQYPKGPALFHSRIGTSGVKDLFNCHPFTMADDPRTVVAHNGILPQMMHPHPKDPRCDTHYAADEIFTYDFGHLSTKRARKRLAQAISSYSKLVILTVDPAYKSNHYIINQDSGEWSSSGMWHSNRDYEGWIRTRPTPTWFNGYGFDRMDDSVYAEVVTHDDCVLCCSRASVDLESQVCEMCNSCMDCYADLSECICYTPIFVNALGEGD